MHGRMAAAGHLPQECPVCCEVVFARRRVRLRACGHTYHRGCINTWLKRAPTCPLCRRWCPESLGHPSNSVAERLGVFMSQVNSPPCLFSTFVAIIMTMTDLTEALELSEADKLFFVQLAAETMDRDFFLGTLRSLGW